MAVQGTIALGTPGVAAAVRHMQPLAQLGGKGRRLHPLSPVALLLHGSSRAGKCGSRLAGSSCSTPTNSYLPSAAAGLECRTGTWQPLAAAFGLVQPGCQRGPKVGIHSSVDTLRPQAVNVSLHGGNSRPQAEACGESPHGPRHRTVHPARSPPTSSKPAKRFVGGVGPTRLPRLWVGSLAHSATAPGPVGPARPTLLRFSRGALLVEEPLREGRRWGTPKAQQRPPTAHRMLRARVSSWRPSLPISARRKVMKRMRRASAECRARPSAADHGPRGRRHGSQ